MRGGGAAIKVTPTGVLWLFATLRPDAYMFTYEAVIEGGLVGRMLESIP